MGTGNIEKIVEIIKEIENKNLEMKEYLSNLKIPSRNDMLKEITRDIINSNPVMQELLEREGKLISKEKEQNLSNENLIEGYYNKIQSYPNKKIIFLREFLDFFQDQISEKDKDVIINSLKDEKSNKQLKERMTFLANTFKLKL